MRVDFDGNIINLEMKTIEVPSNRNAAFMYVLTFRMGRVLSCSCMGNRYGHICTHMKKLQVELDAQDVGLYGKTAEVS